MLEPNIPENEFERQKALDSYAILDTLEESEYDDITKLAAQISGKKIALISLIDNDRQWFKSKQGLSAPETPRSVSFCGHAINTPDKPFIINDSREDARFSDNPLVTGDPHVIFYAGIPLNDTDGFSLGTLCVIDDQPGELSDQQIEALKILSNSVINLLTLRKNNLLLKSEKERLEKLSVDLEELARFPDENPNPILRIDHDLTLLYCNEAALATFIKDFSFENKKSLDSEFTTELKKIIQNGNEQAFLNFTRNSNSYNINFINLPERRYINLYVANISEFKTKAEELKEFYETIFDYFPIDIAVFSWQHEYLYINKQGIRNDEVRNFLIGKTDYDYCDFRNISYDIADLRRSRFNRAKEESQIISWEEEYPIEDGKIKTVQRQFAPIIKPGKASQYVVGYGLDVTALKNTQRDLNEQIEFMRLLNDITTSFVGISSDFFQENVLRNLEIIGKHLKAERAYFMTYNHPDHSMSLQSEWVESGCEPLALTHQQIDLDILPSWRLNNHLQGDPVLVQDTSLLEDGRYKTELLDLSVKSFYSFPCMNNEECVGYIGVDFVSSSAIPSEQEMLLLTLFSQIVSSGYMAIKNFNDIQEQNVLISNMNNELEGQVLIKTAQNQELTQMLANIDKMAMVGELTANITHDLNSPIGSIKAASESIAYTIEKLFSETLGGFNQEQLLWAFKRASVKTNLSVGVLKSMQEKDSWQKQFTEIYAYQAPDRNQLIDGLVKCRVDLNDHDLVSYLLKQTNKLGLIDLMYHTLVIRTFIDSISHSAERASDVIRNLRFYIKEGKKEELEEIVLEESIRTVLSVFQHYLTKGINVTIESDATIKITSYQSKLYQIWSNIIKNAIDAMEGQGEINIRIFSENEKTHVLIANNGPEIPHEILPNIFNKFFTTKEQSMGTGLGLNIVKEIVDEHNGAIFVTSKDSRTVFHFTFE
ncbi:MAG: ATP-binding protein [Flavobacteriia bacterium]